MLIVSSLWFGNTSLFSSGRTDAAPKLIAHRGVHHVYAGDQRSNDTCRAASVEPVTHTFVENTLASMHAAFDVGADVVELDVHLTLDDVFAVFHDWRLPCQTDGEGVTEERLFTYLKTLDVAYNISSDGETYPLRGQGVGMMPSLVEVFSAELKGSLLINFKSRRPREGEVLAERFFQQEAGQQIFGVYGGGAPTRAALNAMPGLRGFDREHLKTCLMDLCSWVGDVTCASELLGSSHCRPHEYWASLVGVAIPVYSAYARGWHRRDPVGPIIMGTNFQAASTMR